MGRYRQDRARSVPQDALGGASAQCIEKAVPHFA
jgi:hypothetical protein